MVLANFAFAKHRFDSTVDPCAKLCLMILPVATILAFMASDLRLKPNQRARAAKGLDTLRRKNAVALGVSADWGIVWEAYLRLFDAGDHDIAGSSEEIECLILVVEKLFVEGRVFQPGLLKPPQLAIGSNGGVGELVLPPKISHSMEAPGVEGQFLTSIVRKQLCHECVFNVDGRPVLMWGELRRDEEQELAKRIENVAKVAIGRLRGDFPKTEMRFFLRALSVRLCRGAFGPGGNQSDQVHLIKNCEKALLGLGCSMETMAIALVDYKDLATFFVELTHPGRPLATKTNREIWGHCLDSCFMHSHFPRRPFVMLKVLVRFYISIEDGSCNVERGFAAIREIIIHHKTSSTSCIKTLDDLALVCATELLPEDLAVKQDGVWVPGVFGLECGILWRAVLGARMGIYPHRETATEKLPMRPGTFKCVKEGVLKAIGAATTSQAPRWFANGERPSLAVALGAQAVASNAGGPRCPYWHNGFLITPKG